MGDVRLAQDEADTGCPALPCPGPAQPMVSRYKADMTLLVCYCTNDTYLLLMNDVF